MSKGAFHMVQRVHNKVPLFDELQIFEGIDGLCFGTWALSGYLTDLIHLLNHPYHVAIIQTINNIQNTI